MERHESKEILYVNKKENCSIKTKEGEENVEARNLHNKSESQ